MIFRSEQVVEANANQFFRIHLDHLTKALVTIKDRAIGDQGHGTLVHRFDHHPVGKFRVGQGDDLCIFRARHNEGSRHAGRDEETA